MWPSLPLKYICLLFPVEYLLKQQFDFCLYCPVFGSFLRMLLSNFSIIDNRLCINRLIIDNRNFNTPSQSGTHYAPHHRNTVSGWRRLQWTVPGLCSWRRGKTNGRRRCWRRHGGKTDRPADHYGCLDHLGGLICISWRHAACGFSQETAGGRVMSCMAAVLLSHAHHTLW